MNPMVLRRADTVPVGEVEVVLAPALVANRGKVEPTFTRAFTYAETGNEFFPSLSIRTGLSQKSDLQLKLDPFLFPEANVAFKLLDKGLKVSFMGGAKLVAFGKGAGKTRLFFLPLTFMIDVPVGPFMLYGAGGLTTGISFFEEGPSCIFQPRVALGLYIPITPHFFVAPEIAAQQSLGGPRSQAAIGNVVSAFALGLGLSF